MTFLERMADRAIAELPEDAPESHRDTVRLAVLNGWIERFTLEGWEVWCGWCGCRILPTLKTVHRLRCKSLTDADMQ